MINYKEFQGFVIKSIKQMLSDKGSVAAHVLAHTQIDGKDALVYIALPEQKDRWRFVTAMGVGASNADMYAFVSEAWYVEAKPADKEDEKILKSGAIMPSQHPDRKEGLFFVFYSRAEPMRLVGIPFTRGSGIEIIFGDEKNTHKIDDARIGNVFELIEKAKKAKTN